MFSNGECLYGDGYYTKIKQAEWDKAVQYVKQQEASKEQAKAQEVAPKQTNGGQETNKKQIVLALSGRTGQQQNYSVQSNNQTIPTQTMEAVFTQVNSAPAHEATTLAQAKSMPTNSVVTSATPKSAPTNGIAKNTVLLKNMSKEEKRNFFENLHKGVNILLTEEEHGRDAVKESCKSQTNEQTNAAVQPSILELRIAQNKDKDMS